TDRNGAASVTAKVNTADNGVKVGAREAGLPAFLSGRHRRPVKVALPERQLLTPPFRHRLLSQRDGDRPRPGSA
ncbi:hypothetical protein ACSFCW_27530, partial [Yokenella regensburgei]|uniref:hypothetical protein n=1 Tax=Yokenella regensburgei TaxID=158877 RepID=UPI003EDADEE5